MKSEELEKLNEEFKFKSPEEIIKKAIELGSNPILSTNFRPYEAAIINEVLNVKKDIPVVWCDSGYNTSYTYQHAEDIINKLGVNVKTYVPKQTVAHRNVTLGIPEHDTPEHKIFTEQVKLEPFTRAMNDFQPDVWFTNLRIGQTELRNNLNIFNWDHKFNTLKVSPFYYYSDEDLDLYLNENQLPNEHRYYDPTKALDNRECGLHVG